MKFIKDIYNKGNLKDYFKRNKVFLIVSILLVLISFLSAFYNPAAYLQVAEINLMPNIINTGSQDFLSLGAILLIEYFYIIFMGFTLSVVSIFMVVLNCVILGLNSTQNIIQMPQLILTLIEYSLALTGSFLVTKIEVRLISRIFSRNFKDIKNKLKVPFKDLILTTTFVIILIIIKVILKLVF